METPSEIVELPWALQSDVARSSFRDRTHVLVAHHTASLPHRDVPDEGDVQDHAALSTKCYNRADSRAAGNVALTAVFAPHRIALANARPR